MTVVEIYTYALSMIFGAIVLVSYRLKLSWYMDNYQSRPWRDIIGEENFGLFSYALGGFLIGLGAYKFSLAMGLF